ncbi:unnamed protein product [Fraxinus pennsylvanica]|uniref:Uncharacterized protein n=1 Tax=Fraxinus pennsylvanica TaxID=56036 RepID=A0AAD1ZVD7_9LAMI|nr:unnamed protein product [Fraxinus pennsylvanica]
MSCLQLTPKPFLPRTHPKLRTAAFRPNSHRFSVHLKPPLHCFFSKVSCSLNSPSEKTNAEKAAFIHSSQNADVLVDSETQNESLNFEVRIPSVPANIIPAPKLSLSDKAFFLLAFIACTTSVAFTSLVVAAVPTLYAMGRAAISLSKLADTAREELPSTMAAIRLSGMEISDLTLELSDLSQEIADGVNKSAQAVQAAEAGIRQIGSLARQQTMSMIQERANLPTISLKPVVTGAASKTSRAVSQATKSIMNMISGGEHNSGDDNGNKADS